MTRFRPIATRSVIMKFISRSLRLAVHFFYLSVLVGPVNGVLAEEVEPDTIPMVIWNSTITVNDATKSDPSGGGIYLMADDLVIEGAEVSFNRESPSLYPKELDCEDELERNVEVHVTCTREGSEVRLIEYRGLFKVCEQEKSMGPSAYFPRPMGVSSRTNGYARDFTMTIDGDFEDAVIWIRADLGGSSFFVNSYGMSLPNPPGPGEIDAFSRMRCGGVVNLDGLVRNVGTSIGG